MKQIFSDHAESFSVRGHVSDDRLKLFLDLKREAEGEVTLDDLLSLLSTHVPSSELDRGVLSDMLRVLEEEDEVKERRIARGVEPQKGRDGKLVLLVKVFKPGGRVEVDSRGFADFASMHLFDNISSGQIVGRVYPPQDGIEGQDVLGQPIKAEPGAEVKLNLDKTLNLQSPPPEKRYQPIEALCDGMLVEKDGKYAVQEEFEIKGDLDYHSGNIDFIGSVSVSGDVHPGFQIRAQTGITVEGSVRRASLYCPGGEIVVKGRIVGGDGSVIISGADLRCDAISGARVEVSGNVHVEKEIRDSQLRSESSVYVPEGTILGGELFSVCGVEAKEYGNSAGTSTVLSLCSDVETSTEYARLMVEVENHERARELLQLHLGPLARNKDRVQLLQGSFKAKVEKMLAKLTAVERSRILLLARKKRMLEGAKRSLVVRVNILQRLYPGVIVRASGKEFAPHDPVEGPSTLIFKPIEGEFVVQELSPLACEFQVGGGEESESEEEK